MTTAQTYQDLDINARINLKGILADWARISTERFQASLDKVLITDRTNKRSGITSTRLSRGYRFGMGRGSAGHQRTGNLKKNWWQAQPAPDHVVLQFLQYGRYLDMGVGRGVGITDRMVNRQLRLGSTGRVRKPWYAKTKGAEFHRLREILANTYTDIPLQALENALSLSLNIPL